MASSVLMFLEAKCNCGLGLTDFTRFRTILSYTLVVLCLVVLVDSARISCDELKCVHGQCQNRTSVSGSSSRSENVVCVCEPGWTGTHCEACGGRIRLSGSEGIISDGIGNYTVDTKCTWLIEGLPNTTIRIRFHQFATECSWDHLYIYDGSSVYDPCVAVLSGLVVPKGSNTEQMPEIVTHSGTAYLHFYSDAAYNMGGFTLGYKMGTCPFECSGYGDCDYIQDSNGTNIDGVCTCEEGRRGEGCEFSYCPNNCTYGSCSGTGDDMTCVCRDSGFNGEDCSIPDTKGYWTQEQGNFLPEDEDFIGRASHKSVLDEDEDKMWVVGGYTFDEEKQQKVYNYDFNSQEWEEVPASGDTYPTPRYGHSIVFQKPKLIMFGGLAGRDITKELWSFDTDSGVWTPLDIDNIQREEGPLAVVGHSAHLIDGIMYIIFGHSPLYGYMNTVQECNMSSIKNYLQCELATTTGAIVKGGYGHSSVYDPDRGKIYIHAGYHSTGLAGYALTDGLYSYDPKQRTWRILMSSDQPRYLHSAVLLNGLMLVFGGNTHNDTSVSQGAQCYSLSFMAYDLECDSWSRLDGPHLQQNMARFGHTAELRDDRMYVFGGFNGLLLSDVFSYTPATCSAYADEESCLATREGIRCVWANANSCTTEADAKRKLNQKIYQSISGPTCPDDSIDDEEHTRVCKLYKNCPSCVSNSYDCTWCDGKCLFGSCAAGESTITEDEQCYENNGTLGDACDSLHNCQACLADETCKWTPHGNTFRCVSQSVVTHSSLECDVPCYLRDTCENCTSAQCMWCGNEQRCVESNSYIVSFLYGQCMEWTTMKTKCPSTRCSGLRTCEICQESPSCGWCDDGSNTGLGSCIEGAYDGPVEATEDEAVISPDICPDPQWYFIDCPSCQCNGHSTCRPGTDECQECQDLTTGPQCQHCQDGYFGDATNGGNCTGCECNGQADLCDRSSGKCFCHTKGVTGDACDTCNESGKYFGDPANGGTCYYSLTTDFQFTFNLSQKDDEQYTQINFMNTPTTPDRNADFTISCSGKALINITVKSVSEPEERLLVEQEECTHMKKEFSHKDFKFGREQNTTFLVYVYGFNTPFLLQISFSQFPQIDLLQFFVTFFSCFLSLLLIAAILWKLKQKYDMCRRRQMMEVEMEQRASRPFSSCNVEINDPSAVLPLLQRKDLPETQNRPTSKRKKPTKSSPISLEPLRSQKAAILSLLIRLPCGDEDYTPPGQSGFAVGSALVSLGNARKSSMDHPKSERRKPQGAGPPTVPNCV